MMKVESVDVLAIGAHPDDVELGCGGTILRLVEAGYRVGVLDLTRGELGTRGTPAGRAREAQRAARLMRVVFRVNLRLRDGDIAVDLKSRTALIRVIRRTQPKLVLTHSPGGHPDHAKAAALVDEAVHHSGLRKIKTNQDRWRPEKVAYWIFFNQRHDPDFVVDISAHYEQRDEAIKAYSSQLSPAEQGEQTYLSDPNFLERVRSFHRSLGVVSGCEYAEAFLLSRQVKVEDPVRC